MVAVLAVAAPARAATDATDDTTATVSRVLVVSLPDVEWSDIQDGRLPHLKRLFAQSAVGGLVTNGVVRPSPISNNYMTLGAGTRAVATGDTAGQGFGVDEDFGRDPAGQVFRTRTGTAPGDGLVYMPIINAIDANDGELYGAEVGLLGDELRDAGVGRAVVANGDGTDPSAPEDRVPPYRRSAVSALMTSAGKVPGGRVDRGLLEPAPEAPFGLRLDPDAVLDAFRRVLARARRRAGRGVRPAAGRPRGTVRVGRPAREDPRPRAGAYGPARRPIARRGRPGPRRRDRRRPLVARRAAVAHAGVGARAGFAPGLLRSSTTRHDGFVNMVDVAPTILRLLGLDRPEAMEGRRMTTGDAGGALATRVDDLVNANEDGLFRDGQVGASMTTVLVLAIVLTVFTALVDWLRAATFGLRGGARAPWSSSSSRSR